MKHVIAILLFISAPLLSGAEIPRPSPEFVFTLPNGQQANLNAYKGKVLAVEFLFTTCPKCQNTAKVLSKLNSEFGKRGFQPIGIAINPNADVPRFVAEQAVTYPVGTATRDAAFAYLQRSIMSPNFYVPQMVFVDRTGTIRAQYGGTDAFFTNEEQSIRAMAEKLLNEAPPVSKRQVPKKKS